MKAIYKLAIPALALVLAASCDTKKDGVTADMVTNSASADGKENVAVSSIKFELDTFRFGEVMEGEKVSHAFKFTNTGTNDLIINNANGSCGCTVPEWPKQPIPPGGSGSIDVVFDSKGKPGSAMKSVTVFANTEPATHKLFVVGNVKPAEK
jgi:hypothetical protein